MRDALDTPEYQARLQRVPQLELQAPRMEEKHVVDCLGGRTKRSYLAMSEADWKRHSFGGMLDAFAPSFSEDYFDWLDLLDAVSRETLPFIMAELGAGYGRWLVHGANLCRLVGRPLGLLIACEAEPTHYEWMQEHFRDNGYSPSSHRLLEAAVSDTPGSLPFYVGSAASWYGQSIAANRIRYGRPRLPDMGKLLRQLTGQERPMDSVRHVKALTLQDIIADVPRIDLMHVDIQGAEYDVLRSSIDLLNSKVDSIHVGTHSPDVEATRGRDMDALVQELLREAGWRQRTRVRPGETIVRAGRNVTFVDGVQSWENPRRMGS